MSKKSLPWRSKNVRSQKEELTLDFIFFSVGFVMVLKKAKKKELTKSQIRNLPEMARVYKLIHKYSLREEAYAAALQIYIRLRKKSSKA